VRKQEFIQRSNGWRRGDNQGGDGEVKTEEEGSSEVAGFSVQSEEHSAKDREAQMYKSS